MNSDMTKVLEIFYLDQYRSVDSYLVTSEEEINEIGRQLEFIKTLDGATTFIIDGQYFLVRLDMIRNISLRWATDKDFSEAE